MWRAVACGCSSFNCQPLPGKIFFNSYCLPLVLMVFIFLSTISGTYSHGASNKFNSNKEDSYADFILCRRCGANLADAKNIINHISPSATVLTNQTLFEQKEVEVQILQNSFNIQFHVITLSNSKCVPDDSWYKAESWYPGYAWKPCVCKQCRVHHGWLFEPIGIAQLNSNRLSNKAFFMLKLHNLLSEKFANSLLVVPRSYIN